MAKQPTGKITIPALIHLGHEAMALVIRIPEENAIQAIQIMADQYGMECVDMRSSNDLETHKLMTFEVPDGEWEEK